MGYMVLFEVGDDKLTEARFKRVIYVITLICMFYAVILRTDAFLLGTAISGVYGIIRFFVSIKKESFAVALKKYIAIFSPVFIIYLVCSVADNFAYSEENWNSFE